VKNFSKETASAPASLSARRKTVQTAVLSPSRPCSLRCKSVTLRLWPSSLTCCRGEGSCRYTARARGSHHGPEQPRAVHLQGCVGGQEGLVVLLGPTGYLVPPPQSRRSRCLSTFGSAQDLDAARRGLAVPVHIWWPPLSVRCRNDTHPPAPTIGTPRTIPLP